MTLAGICELVLETADVEGLRRFYAGLGLTPLAEEGDRVWLAAGEGVVALAEDGNGT
jgi:catechol-2,3-dioxygenase